MLPEIGGLEWLVIAVVALVVIGPKDLPVMMRKVGQFMAKLRGMANEFRASFDEMARQSELDELRKEVEAMRRGQFADMAAHDAELRRTVSDIEQGMADVGVQLHPPMSYQYDTTTAPPEAPPLEIAEAPAKPARKPRAKKPKVEAVDAAPIVETPKARKPRSKKIVEAGS
ncbi:Sec-independent protein translocase protein TatB [Phenylobacterium kunshanense]|uniref:Sec-independent protein translocase protein TatB n=1 Tax=Phenylobacterium kunshanense TaxID=1445034 RepID=A0A328B6M2_9CAUL|nr:Sec-independent protein translocase protein TatB [Phenylobacterium kunshanense]RAK62041.1 twin-arginine translocase subunit TatB [Phenylobacterium kunshanense]